MTSKQLSCSFLIFICAALARGQSPSPAESTPAVRVDKIDIVEKGLYRVQLNETVNDPNVLSGHRYVHSKGELIKDTTTVPAVSGVQFGLRYLLTGEPQGAKVPIRVVVHYPEARQNAKTGQTALQDEFPQTSTIGGPPGFFFMYVKSGLVLGVWTMEVWCQDRKLAEQKFTMATPPNG